MTLIDLLLGRRHRSLMAALQSQNKVSIAYLEDRTEDCRAHGGNGKGFELIGPRCGYCNAFENGECNMRKGVLAHAAAG